MYDASSSTALLLIMTAALLLKMAKLKLSTHARDSAAAFSKCGLVPPRSGQASRRSGRTYRRDGEYIYNIGSVKGDDKRESMIVHILRDLISWLVVVNRMLLDQELPDVLI